MFSYCENNPGCFKDKSGNYRTWAIPETDGYHEHHNQDNTEDYYVKGKGKKWGTKYIYTIQKVDEVPEEANIEYIDRYYSRSEMIKWGIRRISVKEVQIFDQTFSLFPHTTTTVYIEFYNVNIKLTITITDYPLSDWISAINDELYGMINIANFGGGHVVQDVVFPCIR